MHAPVSPGDGIVRATYDVSLMTCTVMQSRCNHASVSWVNVVGGAGNNNFPTGQLQISDNGDKAAQNLYSAP